MGQRSNDLLQLERKNPSSSSIGLSLPVCFLFRILILYAISYFVCINICAASALLICDNDSLSRNNKKPSPDEKPITTTPVPTSQVLGKVRDFLGVISEANRRLELDAKEQSSKDYDIEVLNGNESQYIEMDLMLGIADLHTPEAVAAAKSAISGYQPVIPLAASSSGTESEDSSDDDDDDDDDDDSDSGDDGIKDEKDKTCSSVETKRSKSMDDNALTKLQKHQLKKRPKIVELP